MSGKKTFFIGVSTVAIGGILATIFYDLIQSSTPYITNFLTYGVPLWIMISFLILVSVGYYFYKINYGFHVSDTDDVALDSNSNNDSKEEITYKDYKTDIVDSVKWEWIWDGKNIMYLKPLCPDCSYELKLMRTTITELDFKNIDVVNGTRKDAYSVAYAFCKCGFSCAWYNHPNDVKNNTIKEIERRVRTGDFKKAIGKYGNG